MHAHQGVIPLDIEINNERKKLLYTKILYTRTENHHNYFRERWGSQFDSDEFSLPPKVKCQHIGQKFPKLCCGIVNVSLVRMHLSVEGGEFHCPNFKISFKYYLIPYNDMCSM